MVQKNRYPNNERNVNDKDVETSSMKSSLIGFAQGRRRFESAAHHQR
jgi:hypothetical protein